MKPEQFIREHGVERAREVVEGAPDWATHFDLTHKDHYQVEDGEECCLEDLDTVDLSDLKRLVESLDIVRVIGPIEYTRSVVTNAPVNAIGYDTMYEGYFGEETKHYYENLRTFTIDQIKEAVAVHESIYGGGESHAN
ncbi:hypothetical protein Q5X71_03205 [Acinetobacter baumannii]|nr:hypothetical protein [Acinetobacter baumannii]